MNKKLLNVSSSPHIRSSLTTGKVMLDVMLALLPAAVCGVVRNGLHAFLIIAVSMVTAMLAEFIFDYIAKKPNTVRDGSAAVTGLLLALSLSPSVPLYIPAIGSIFAILFVKCFFGGLGKNFMNPALAGRCFLLISFGSIMTSFPADAVSSSTPLAALKAGESIHLAALYSGNASGVIGGSAAALLIGGLMLWLMGGITLEIPVSCILAFLLFMGLFGGQGFDPKFLLAHLCGGGLLMGAFFMATDPVTSPVTPRGHMVYGACIGILAGIFRVYGTAADSFSYAIILSNLLVPFIDRLPIPKPLGYKTNGENEKREFPKAAVNLTIITLIAGLALSSVYMLTKPRIEEQALLANAESYREVCPDADTFETDENFDAAIEALEGNAYDAKFGRTFVNTAIVAKAADGSTCGYVISVTTADGFDGNITLSVGLTADGTVTGIAFTELNETAGMGMRADEEEFKSQFNGVNTDAFVLNKQGNASADNEIDTVSGASVTSSAVVNAVNTALAFYADNVQ